MKLISLEEARENDEFFEKIGNHSNVDIYSTNDSYPSDEEITKSGELIEWNEIIKNTSIKNYKELNKALMTSVGGFKKKLQRLDLLEILNHYSEKENIRHPLNGTFNFFTKSTIYDILKSKDITKIEVVDEFLKSRKTIDIKSLNKKEFCDTIDYSDYYIYTIDNSILFSIDWDYFFFFIAVDEKCFSKSDIEKHFEGFWADKNDTHLWTWDKGEIKRLLKTDN